MNANTKEFLKEKTNDLINAYSCSKEAKEAAQKWLKSLDTENETCATKQYFAELEECILPIDELIAFTASSEGKKLFGEETAKAAHEHGLQLKAQGAKYCDCPACSAVAAMFTKKEELFG